MVFRSGRCAVLPTMLSFSWICDERWRRSCSCPQLLPTWSARSHPGQDTWLQCAIRPNILLVLLATAPRLRWWLLAAGLEASPAHQPMRPNRRTVRVLSRIGVPILPFSLEATQWPMHWILLSVSQKSAQQVWCILVVSGIPR